MIVTEVVEKIRKACPNLHPLIFHRSVERAKSEGELFDIIMDVPTKYPVIWDEIDRRWIHADDPTMKKDELS